MGLALWAIPFPNGQGKLLGNESADMAAFAGREETVNDLQFLTVPQALVFGHSSEHGHAHIADGPCQAVIGDHAHDVQVFNGEYIEASNERCRQLVEIVLATVCDMRLQSGYLDALTIPSTASFVPTGKNTLQPSQLGRVVAEVFRVGYTFARGQRCQSVYSEVYTHNFSGLGKGVHFFVEAKSRKVTASTILGYRNRAGVAYERPRPVNVQPANAGEVQVPIHGVPPERTPGVFSGLPTVLTFERRIRTPFVKEVFERGLKVSKGLLLGNTGCFLQPRNIVGVAMLCPFGRTGEVVDGFTATKRIGTKTKCPVIGMADTTEHLGKFTLLRRRWVEAVSIFHIHINMLTCVRNKVNIYIEEQRRAKARGFNPEAL